MGTIKLFHPCGLTAAPKDRIFNQLTSGPLAIRGPVSAVRNGRSEFRTSSFTAEPWRFTMSKRTFQPNNRRRAKVHGFRLRMRTRAGRAILGARRRKGRVELSA